MHRRESWLSRLTRRRGLRRVGMVAVAALSLVAVYTLPANAVHDLGVFQLDKNASTAVNPAPTALEDWDLICKANPTNCTFASGYTQPSATTTSDPNSFVVDPSESATDDILKGGTKDDNDINSWKWASAKPSPPKNDITDAYAAEYTAPTTNDKLLYFGADRFSNSGSANIAFWFFQHDISRSPATGTCSAGAGCPFVGTHTVGDVSLGGTTPGDILIISAFGPKAAINIYEWVGPGNATSPCFTNACSLQPLFTGGQACEDVTSDNACATVNDVVTPSPWTLKQKGGPDNSFQPTNFFEGGLNLTNLKVDACFSSFLVNTRASAAGDAELHDMVLGRFARCQPSMDTTSSSQGTVQPGTAVHDTATISVTGASNPADPTGTVTFFLCGPNANAAPDCSTGGTNVGTGQLADSSVPANTTDGIASATSPNVNVSPVLANGYYCWRAEWPGDTNYPVDPSPLKHTNATTECFRVLQLSTTTVTTPQAPAGTNISGNVAINTNVFDYAKVTGDAAGGTPTGTVDFFICDPSQVTGAAGAEVCADGDGTALADNPRTVTAIANSSPPASEATSSPAVTADKLGVWCFRAVYTPDTAVYTGSSDATHGECFTVTTTSAATSAQNWLPNDSVTITTGGGVALNGSLDITLRSGTCTGTVVYTEDGDPNTQGNQPITVTNQASGSTFTTSNTTFKVTDANEGTYFWRAVFTPTSPFISPVTKCETSTVTINDNP